MRGFPVFVFFLLIFALPAQAQDAAGDRLRQALERQFAENRAVLEKEGRGLRAGDGMTIEKRKDFYAVTLPDVAFLFSGGARLEAGTVTLNAKEAAGNSWTIGLILPAQLNMTGEDGKPEARITLGAQRASYVWHPDQGIAPRFDALYNNITLSGLGEERVQATLKEFKATMKLTQGRDGKWSGPGVTELTGFAATASREADENLALAFDKLSLRSSYEGVDLAQGAKLKRELQNASGAEAQALTFSALDYLRTFASSLDNNFSLTNARLHGATAQGPVDFKVGSLSAKMSVKGLRNETADATFVNEVRGLAIGGLTPAAAAFIPTDARAEIDVRKLPYAALFDLAEAADAQAPQKTVSDILGAAGTTVTVKDTSLRTASFLAQFAGMLTALPAAQSPLGLTGDMTFDVTGADETLAKLDQEATPQAGPSRQILTMIQMLGQASTAEDGRSKRSYKFQLRPDGGIMLNGADVRLLMPMAQPQAPVPPQAR